MKQLRWGAARAIRIADAVRATLAAQMLAQQLTGAGIKQPHEHRVPLHMHLPPDPARRRAIVSCFNFDTAVQMTVWCDTTTGFTRQLQAKDLHDAVASFSLDPAVPENIAQHFETVKNLFLYSWFIYRFQPIAELQSLACLEYALRDRLGNEILMGKFNEKRPGLQKLLRYAIENQLVKNEGFDRWVRSHDPEWDLLASLEKALPRIRNDYAHGTYNLAPTALGIIELVHEIINQLFQSSTPKHSGQGRSL